MKFANTSDSEIDLLFLSKFIENSEDGFFAFNHDFQLVFWSPVMESLSGIEKSSAIGRNIFELFPVLKEVGEDAYFIQALAGKSWTSKNKQFHLSESEKSGYFDSKYFPILSEQGAVLAGACILRDVTEAKRARQLQQETDTLFQSMADHSPVMLWMAGADSLCNFFNQSWLTFSGRTLEQEWGVGWSEGVHAEDFQRCIDTYMDAFNKRIFFEMEYRLKRADGVYRWILDRGVPRYTPNNTFAGFIGSCVDITERRQIEVELKRAVQIREDFLSIASHELKTPLTSLNLQLGMLAHVIEKSTDQNPIEEQVQNVSEIGRRQLKKLNELIESLLDVSKISAGKMILERSSFDLKPLVGEILNRMDEQLRSAGCEVRINLGEQAAVGAWDRARIEQVAVNLLSNAIKYAPGNPVEIKISVLDDFVAMVVRDHGIGIPLDEQAGIFDKFHRAANARNRGGLGLGLFIVKQIVEAHGGKLGVVSKVNEGSSFTVELPLLRKIV